MKLWDQIIITYGIVKFVGHLHDADWNRELTVKRDLLWRVLSDILIIIFVKSSLISFGMTFCCHRMPNLRFSFEHLDESVIQLELFNSIKVLCSCSDFLSPHLKSLEQRWRQLRCWCWWLSDDLLLSAYGNLVVGPTAEDCNERTSPTLSDDVTRRLIEYGHRIVPALSQHLVIGTYAGLRPATETKDYHLYATPERLEILYCELYGGYSWEDDKPTCQVS